MRPLILLLTFFVITFTSFAQSSIGVIPPDPSSMLHLESSGAAQGLLLPRLTDTQRNSILSPTAGLIIYNTTNNTLEVVISTNQWDDIINGNQTPVSVGTPTSKGLVGIGTISPNANAILEVFSTSKGVILPMSATDPVGVAGMIYYNTTDDVVKLYNDSQWVVLNN